MTNALQEYLQENVDINFVYVNDKGQWQFHQRPGYDKVLTRDEVLDMKVASETTDPATQVQLSTTAGKVSDKAGKKAKPTTETKAQKAEREAKEKADAEKAKEDQKQAELEAKEKAKEAANKTNP